MAGSSELVVLDPPWDKELATGTESHDLVSATPREDFRVRCTSKRAVTEMLQLCGRFVQKLGDALPEEIREPALRDAQWTFESAMQENISINGQAWQEASDNCFMDSDIKVLEDQFDEIIVDIATKRKQYPRKILECVIKTIKAKQEILSLPALIEQGEGFSQVLRMQPVIHLQRIHQEVFSSCYRKPDAKPENFITQIETTPTETASRKTSDVVLKRKQTKDCPQRKWYPLRPKKINLDT
ncbi:PREDICTED: kinetochore-associated protein NSL1 homolog isoform X3 [Colobus angolensis palliatus]|uniref:kinetochore-associated protein NSL1 homolog isoform X3 n=1 Tax=Colobus angolensis palliatus TaxID=336983 RepID=UPI0005F39C89|nr:PREDICTED: kinetochore-associated protein NSL1 homolog isoform X3 [Colobus angolensis palliatus]